MNNKRFKWNLEVIKPITMDFGKTFKIYKPIIVDSQNFKTLLEFLNQ